MNYSVADAIACMGGDAVSGRTGDISSILPYGIAPGAKAVMRKEKEAAEEAISTGIYVTWRSMKTGQDCARVGSILPICKACECRGFDFVPSRPEEIGEWWLPRRPGFDASSWRAKCRCGHSHEEHHPSRRSCGLCKCGEFYSAYGCVVCECRQEDHQTQVENAQQRVDADRPVGRDFIPLSQSPQLSQLTFGRKSRRPPAGVRSSSESAAIGATARGSGGGGELVGVREQPPVGTSSSSMAHKARRSRLSTESSHLAVAGGGAGRAAHARRPSLGTLPASAVSTTALASLSKGKMQPTRLTRRPTPNRGEARRVSNNHGGSTAASASPELLVASGRITARRYHEMLAEIDGRRGGGSAAGRDGVGTIDPAARKAAETPQRKVGVVRRDEEGTPAMSSFGQNRSNVAAQAGASEI